MPGLFEAGKPSSRQLAGQFSLLAAPEHRAVARQAVRESLVLLKNSQHLLPLKPSMNVLVAGDGADNIPKQSGGWSLTWQGTGVTNTHFPNAESIFAGIRSAVVAGGGKAVLSPTGAFTTRPDVAIVVFGEEQYAEFQGDIETLEYKPGNKVDLELLRKLRAEKIPVVAVFLSGRPLWVNPELNASDAFVAAWLPGSEGGGVADVLFARQDGTVNHDFKGKLSFSWPRTPDQVTATRGAGQPLFAYGFGLTYKDSGELEALSEDVPQQTAGSASTREYFTAGRATAGWKVTVGEGSGARQELATATGATGSGVLKVTAIDRSAQEDGRLLQWSGAGPATLAIERAAPLDLQREANGQLSLVFDYRVDAAPTDKVVLGVECQGGADRRCGAEVPIDAQLRSAPKGQWQQYRILLGCFQKGGASMQTITSPATISTAGSLQLGIANVRLDTGLKDTVTCE